jgi:hypothetical protein
MLTQDEMATRDRIYEILESSYEPKQAFLDVAGWKAVQCDIEGPVVTLDEFRRHLEALVSQGLLLQSQSGEVSVYKLAGRSTRKNAMHQVCDRIRKQLKIKPQTIKDLVGRGMSEQSIRTATDVLIGLGLIRVQSKKTPRRLEWNDEQEEALKDLASAIEEKKMLERKIREAEEAIGRATAGSTPNHSELTVGSSRK